jgi:uncharacterized protein with HEPN domain
VSRDVLLILQDIENACRKIIQFTHSLDRDAVQNDVPRLKAQVQEMIQEEQRSGGR